MSKITNNKFVKMIGKGISGAIIGIIAGTILGIFIFYLQFPLSWLSSVQFNQLQEYSYQATTWPNLSIPGTLGACFGAIIGSIFGGILGIKNDDSK